MTVAQLPVPKPPREPRARGVATKVRWCDCVGVAMGSYENQVTLHYPYSKNRTDPRVGVDRCIAQEVRRLWRRGVRTTGCCCGHNVAHPYIGVEFGCIPQMKAMGYEVAPNRCRPGDEDSFYPMSVKYPRWRRLWRRACVGLMILAFGFEDLVS